MPSNFRKANPQLALRISLGHWELDASVTNHRIMDKRRWRVHYADPKRERKSQSNTKSSLASQRLATANQRYDPTPIINSIRKQVDDGGRGRTQMTGL